MAIRIVFERLIINNCAFFALFTMKYDFTLVKAHNLSRKSHLVVEFARTI